MARIFRKNFEEAQEAWKQKHPSYSRVSSSSASLVDAMRKKEREDKDKASATFSKDYDSLYEKYQEALFGLEEYSPGGASAPKAYSPVDYITTAPNGNVAAATNKTPSQSPAGFYSAYSKAFAAEDKLASLIASMPKDVRDEMGIDFKRQVATGYYSQLQEIQKDQAAEALNSASEKIAKESPYASDFAKRKKADELTASEQFALDRDISYNPGDIGDNALLSKLAVNKYFGQPDNLAKAQQAYAELWAKVDADYKRLKESGVMLRDSSLPASYDFDDPKRQEKINNLEAEIARAENGFIPKRKRDLELMANYFKMGAAGGFENAANGFVGMVGDYLPGMAAQILSKAPGIEGSELGQRMNAFADRAMTNFEAITGRESAVVNDAWRRTTELEPTDAEQEVGKHISNIGQIAGNVWMAGGGAPQVPIPANPGITSKIASYRAVAPLALSAAGGETSKLLNNGVDLHKAVARGLIQGAIEGIPEIAFGGIPGYGEGVLSSALQKVMPRMASSPIVQEIIRRATDAFGEGAEEILSEALSPIVDRMMIDPETPLATLGDLLSAGGGGAVISLILGIGESGFDAIGRPVIRSTTHGAAQGLPASTEQLNRDIAEFQRTGVVPSNQQTDEAFNAYAKFYEQAGLPAEQVQQNAENDLREAYSELYGASAQPSGATSMPIDPAELERTSEEAVASPDSTVETPQGMVERHIDALAKSGGYSEPARAEILRSFRENKDSISDPSEYASAFNAAYKAGQLDSADYEDVAQGLRSKAPEVALRAAWNIGQNERQGTTREMPTEVRAVEPNVVDNTSGTASSDFVELEHALAQKTGIEIRIEDTLINKDGQAANGNFEARLLRMTIAADADNPLTARLHETMEFARAFAPEKMAGVYREVAKMLIARAGGAENFADAIATYANGYKGTVEDAAREYMNDAIAGVFATPEGFGEFSAWLSDSKTITQAQKKSTLQTIADFLQNMLEKIHAFITGENNRLNNSERALLGEEEQKLEKLRAQVLEALDEAVENRKALPSTGIEIADEARYSQKMQDTIREYKEAVDPKMLALAERFKANKNAKFERYVIGNVSERAADDIQDLTGVNVRGYESAINKSAFIHIENRHGENGAADHSMADLNDVARMRYVLENYDTMKIARDQNGDVVFSSKYHMANSSPAPVLLFSKRINGTYYISEAVTDAKWQKVWVTSARIEKRNQPHTGAESANTAPSYTSKTPPALLADSDDASLAQENNGVKGSVREESDDDARFSLKAPIETAGDLVAVHNLTEAKLKKVLQLGAFPMPSIAVTKSSIPHTNFGDISLVFDRSTIDPKASPRNKVYSADAWTSVVPKTEYEIDDKKARAASQALASSASSINPALGQEARRFMNQVDDYINGSSGMDGLMERAYTNAGIQAAFLADQSLDVQPEMEEKRWNAYYDNEAVRWIAEQHDNNLDNVMQAVNGAQEARERMIHLTKEAVRAQNRREFPNLDSMRPHLRSAIEKQTNEIGFSHADSLFTSAANYLRAGGASAQNQEVDMRASEEKFRKLIDREAFDAWADGVFGDLVKSEGIRNNADLFTPQGNRRTFKQLHVPVTAENIVNVMRGEASDQRHVVSFNGPKSLRAVTAKSFKSLDEIRSAKPRLQHLSQEEAERINDEFNNVLSALTSSIYEANKAKLGSNQFIGGDAVGEAILEAASKRSISVNSIDKTLKEWNITITPKQAAEIYSLILRISETPVNIFEAKPERVVGLYEIKLAVLPEGKYSDVRAALAEMGIPVEDYNADNEDSRVDVLNGAAADALRFSLRGIEAPSTEVQRLMEASPALSEFVRTTMGEFKRSKPLTQRVVRKSVDLLLKEIGVGQNSAEVLTSAVFDLMSSISDSNSPLLSRPGTYESAWYEVRNLVATAIHNSGKLDTGLHEQYSDLLREMRTVGVSLDSHQRAEVENAFDSVNAFRKANFGRVLFTNDGIPLDSKWVEWSQQYPELFDADANSNEQPILLAQVWQALQPQTRNEFSGNIEESAAVHATALLEGLLGKTQDTFANRMRQEARDSKRAALKELNDEWVEKYKRLRSSDREKLKEAVASARTSLREQAAQRALLKNRRKSVTRHVKGLLSKLKANNRHKNIPLELQEAILPFLESLDMSYNRHSASNALNNAITRLTEKFKPYLSGDPAGNEILNDLIASFKESLTDGVNLGSMDADQLFRLDQLLTTMDAMARAVQALPGRYRNMTVNEVAAEVTSYAETVKEAKGLNKALQSLDRMANSGNMRFIDAMDQLGSGGEKIASIIFDALDEYSGFQRESQVAWEARDKAHGINPETVREQYTDSKNKIRIELSNGQWAWITQAQLANLITTYKTTDGKRRIGQGGFRLSTIRKRSGGEFGKIEQIDKLLRPTDADMVKLESLVDPKLLSWFSDEQKRMASTLAERGNVVTREMYGINRYMLRDYWPLETYEADRANGAGAPSDTYYYNGAENQGFTKDRTKTSAPVFIRDGFDLVAQHEQGMNNFAAFTMPINIAYRWYNHTDVQTAVKHLLGDDMRKYMSTLLMDAQGFGQSSARTLERGFHKLVRNAKRAAVYASPTVILQQHTAGTRAQQVIPEKFWIASAGQGRKAYDENLAHLPLLWMKIQGNYDIGVTRSNREVLAKDLTKLQKRIAFIADQANASDGRTWNRIANAVRLWVESEGKYEVGSDAYWEEVRQRFDKVIHETQVIDTPFDRTESMRSGDLFTKSLTAFMSEPLLQVNRIRNGLVDVARHGPGKGRGKRIVRDLAWFVVADFQASFMANLIKNAFLAMGDDDKKWEAIWENIMNRTVFQISDFRGNGPKIALTGLMSLHPLLRQISNVIEGYDASDLSLSALTDLVEAVSNAMSKKSSLTLYGKARNISTALAQLKGVPLRSWLNILEPILELFGQGDLVDRYK
ncbi:MAG: hypothetical protein LBD02_01440 [Christensenellaceae bacterium]|jgi:hypothetical protein|nr:hypothetical protein [Christensenellaceae bacterium]